MTTNRLRRFRSQAPTRIDLAGGTVDIWPIYLFLENALTLNLAIDLFAETELVETLEPGRVVLRSEDQNIELQTTWADLNSLSPPPGLVLHWKFLKFFEARKKEDGTFNPAVGLRLATSAKSPAGAGLGGSSTLSISLIAALRAWQSDDLEPQKHGSKFIDIVKDTETTVIKVPAGLQDYYAAMFGGLQTLRWLPGEHRHENWKKETLAALESRILLFYSGHSRKSGINNWALFKDFIDQKGKVQGQFKAINEATHALESALRTGDWSAAGEAIRAEWETRRELAEGISTPEIDQAFKAAFEQGATSGKICGAGGGGCFFIYVASGDPQLKLKIQTEIAQGGIRSLPFRASPTGVSVYGA